MPSIFVLALCAASQCAPVQVFDVEYGVLCNSVAMARTVEINRQTARQSVGQPQGHWVCNLRQGREALAVIAALNSAAGER